MNILYVASEVSPFAISGGLGDVMGTLPLTVKQSLKDNDRICVILPLYSSIPDTWRSKMRMHDEFEFMYGWRHSYCGIHTLTLKGVEYYFIDNEQYFMRHSLYGEYDDAERFAYFCRAVIEFILRMDVTFDILHANDWQSALSVVYAKTRFRQLPAFSHIKTVFTIHNIEYQGKYDRMLLGNIFDLDTSYESLLDFDGCLNLMKGAIVCSDLVTTVSPTYANEIKEPYFAYGLANIIQDNASKLTGIVNGIDMTYFSSQNGTDIVATYDTLTARVGKAANKIALQRELGLEENADIPLVAMICRLTHGKGVDLVLHIFEEMMQQSIQFVLLGTGDESYERIFADLCRRYPNRAKAVLKFDRLLSKRIYASADLFLMPSKSEPCGLAQMMACRYGTLPLVHRVGGLADTIEPYPSSQANGFGFKNFNAHELLFTLKDALHVYQNSKEWDRMVTNAMLTDYSWHRSAERYIQEYKRIIR